GSGRPAGDGRIPAGDRTWGSIRVGADDLAAGTGAEAPPDVQCDRILDEPDRAVTHHHVHPSGVGAAGTDGYAFVGQDIVAAVKPAAIEDVVGLLDGVEQGEAGDSPDPAVAPVIVDAHGPSRILELDATGLDSRVHGVRVGEGRELLVICGFA